MCKTFGGYHPIFPARKQNVAAFHFVTSGKPGLGIKQYDDGGRTKMQFFMCQFIRPARLKSRGLCKQKKIDTFYSLLYDAKSNLPYFNGYHKTVIRLEENLDTIGAKKFWQISEEKGNRILQGLRVAQAAVTERWP